MLLPCMPGHSICEGCGVKAPAHSSHLCPHCQQHCQCRECFNEFPFEALRFGVCATCYPTKQWPYHFVKKEKPVCLPNLPQ